MKYINWSTTIFQGFYESDLYNSDTLYNINMEEDTEYDFKDDKAYYDFENEVCEKIVDALFYDMQDAEEITGIKFIKLHSPKYYNYDTDKIECDIQCDWQGVLKYAQETKREDFENYLHDNFTSCSGFVSFVPNNAKDFFNKLEEDFERLSQVILEFYIEQHLDYELYREHCYEIAQNTLWQYIEEIEPDKAEEVKPEETEETESTQEVK